MSELLLFRKFRSLLIKLGRISLSLTTRIRINFLYPNVSVGKNVFFGRLVSIRTSDLGKIIISDNVSIDNFCLLLAQKGTLTIGKGTYLGHGTHICTIDNINIGENCLIAAYCIIRDMKHGTEVGIPINEQKQDANPVIVGDDVWLGAHTVVTAGVTIGDGTIIGANSVVTKDIASGKIAAGVPTKVLRNRSGEYL